MKSLKLGKSISEVEILNVSQNGIWILVVGKEYFIPHKGFPWFQNARLSEIYNVHLMHKKSLHWPDLDVDLDLESLENLESYPLIYKK